MTRIEWYTKSQTCTMETDETDHRFENIKLLRLKAMYIILGITNVLYFNKHIGFNKVEEDLNK